MAKRAYTKAIKAAGVSADAICFSKADIKGTIADVEAVAAKLRESGLTVTVHHARETWDAPLTLAVAFIGVYREAY